MANTPQALGVVFQGATVTDSGFVPPDSMGAAGPSQFIVIVNGRIRSFAKATGTADGVLDSSTDTFFSSVRNASGTSDPRIRYDRLTGRWWITIITVSIPNRILVAFSASGVITNATNFTFNYFDVGTLHSGCLWDYDSLGIDVHALYIGGNLFCGVSQTFTSSEGLVVPLPKLLTGSGPAATDLTLTGNGLSCPSSGEGPYSPQGVDNYDPASTVGYFAGTSICFYGRLDFVRIANPGTASPTGTLLTLTVATTDAPLSVSAQGSTHPLDALDDRLFAAQLRNGHLWTAHNVCVTSAGVANAVSCNRDGSRWYDIINLGTTPGEPVGHCLRPGGEQPTGVLDPIDHGLGPGPCGNGNQRCRRGGARRGRDHGPSDG